MNEQKTEEDNGSIVRPDEIDPTDATPVNIIANTITDWIVIRRDQIQKRNRDIQG